MTSYAGTTMARRWSVAELKATLSERLREVKRGQTVMITRNGKPIAALLPAAAVERLERVRAAGPEGGLASVAGGWQGSDELVQNLATLRRTAKRRRRRRG
jgi:prevent-host-death family protein